MTKRYYKYGETHRTANGVKQKLCTKCKKWKDESQFCTSRKSKDGLQWRCRNCESKYTRKYYERNRKGARRNLRHEDCHRVINWVKEKLCTKCKKWKKESEYYKHRSTKDGLSNPCKKCTDKAASKSYEPKRKGVRRNLRYVQRHRVVKGVKQKFCRMCKRWISESEFYKDRSQKDGLDDRCKKCTYKPVKKSYEPKRKGARRNLRYEDRHRIVKGVKQKYCRKCKRWKDEGVFYKNRSAKDGLDDRCKKCSYKPVKKSRKPKRKRKRKRKSVRRNLRYEDRHRIVNC